MKRTTFYVSITVSGLSDGCCFVFLDIMQYLAPGFNLDIFIKSFAGDKSCHKLYFPYEYVDSHDRLAETELPPYDAFVMELQQENQLDSEYQTCLVQKLGLARDAMKVWLSPDQLEKALRLIKKNARNWCNRGVANSSKQLAIMFKALSSF